MNILFVNDIPFNPRYGGIERVTDLIVRELLKYGYNIYYLSGKVSKTEILNYSYPVKLYQLPENGFFAATKNKEYYRSLLKELEINVVVNQRGTFDFMDSVLHYAGIRTISVLHSVMDSSVICYFYSRQENFKWKIKNYVKKCFYPLYVNIKKRQLYKDLYKHYAELIRKDSTIVVLSNSCAKELAGFIKPLEADIKIINNPCNIPMENINLDIKDKTILFVGRLDSAEKQPIRLLKVWKRLYKQYKEWGLVFVGDGDAMNVMQKFVSKNNIERVTFAGQQSNVAEYYRKASFVCLTSNYEGWGMALTEGMAYGCIPFAFNSFGAASEIIDDGVNGCLVSPFSIVEYSDKLGNLMQEDDLRKNMALAAIDKVKIFSLNNVVAKWDNLFKSLTEN